jgi:hypothetical protein
MGLNADHTQSAERFARNSCFHLLRLSFASSGESSSPRSACSQPSSIMALISCQFSLKKLLLVHRRKTLRKIRLSVFKTGETCIFSHNSFQFRGEGDSHGHRIYRLQPPPIKENGSSTRPLLLVLLQLCQHAKVLQRSRIALHFAGRCKLAQQPPHDLA